MGVGGVNSTNTDLSIYKKLNQQSTSTTTAKPDYMTKDGSVFNAPGVKSLYGSSSSATTSTITPKTGDTSNTGTPVVTSDGDGSSGTKSADDLIKGKSASEGRAAAKSAQEQQGPVKQQTNETEQNTATTNSISSQTQQTAQQVKKDDQTFKATNNKTKSSYNKTNQEIKNINKSIQTEQAELTSLTSELDALVNADKTGIGTHSAFSLNLAGTEQSSGADTSTGDMEKIQDLQNRIGEKTNVIQIYNQKVTVLTKTSNSTLRSMERVNNAYVKTTQATQKQVEANQNEVSGFMKFANDFNEIATTVTQVGQTVKYAGMAFIAMGGIPVVGAALAAAGNVMKPIGEATEAIGNYGQCAANVMLAAGNIAEGNFVGALTNIATAVQTGASAVQSTKAAKNDFKALGKETDAATKAADEAMQKADEVKEKAAEKAQETTSAGAPDPTAPVESKPTSLAEMADKPEMPDKVEVPGSTNTAATTPTTGTTTTTTATATTGAPDPTAPIDAKPTSLADMAKGTEMPDKIEIKEGSGIDKAIKSANKDVKLKAEAKAAWAELKADSKKIQSTLLAMGQKAESTPTTSSGTEQSQVEIELSDKAKEIIKKGQQRRQNIQAKYGSAYSSGYSNPVFYMYGRKIA